MDVYKVHIFPTAEEDLIGIIDCLNTLPGDAPIKYYNAMIEEINSLSTLPNRCPKQKDLALAAKEFRYLIVKDYNVFFLVFDNTVQIRRILHNRRNYSRLF